MARMIVLAALLAMLGPGGALAAECNRFAVQVATDPAPHQYPHGLENAYSLFSNVPAEAKTILIGDSLVANWPQDMASRQFGSGAVWNFAVGGSVSQNTLWQLGQLKAPHLAPDRIVVLVGTNNLTHDYMPACAIADGIKAVVNAAHSKWPAARIHVMGIPPRGMDFRFRDKARLAVNAAIKDWARGLAHVHYFQVDDSEFTCGHYGRTVEVADTSRTTLPQGRCANYADDFGHFKRAGYEIIFAAMMGK